MKGTIRGLLWVVGVFLVLCVAVVMTYTTVPPGNTDQTRFDTIIMLGYPANPDGSPSPEERERVMEAVREFQRGRASHLIVTGGAAHNNWVEAMVEAGVARSAGVPAEDILTEVRSTNTIENMYYTWQIMKAHGWTSAEVVSSGSHLPRASLILQHYEPLGLKWHVHAAAWPREYPVWKIAAFYLHEAQGTATLRWFGYRPSPYLPAR